MNQPMAFVLKASSIIKTEVKLANIYNINIYEKEESISPFTNKVYYYSMRLSSERAVEH
jgi:hypothetical protein